MLPLYLLLLFFSSNSYVVVTDITSSLNFTATALADAAPEFETSGFDFANASQITIATHAIYVGSLASRVAVSYPCVAVSSYFVATSSHATTVRTSHANSDRGKLPVWRASTLRTMCEEVFPAQDSLLLPP